MNWPPYLLASTLAWLAFGSLQSNQGVSKWPQSQRRISGTENSLTPVSITDTVKLWPVPSWGP